MSSLMQNGDDGFVAFPTFPNRMPTRAEILHCPSLADLYLWCWSQLGNRRPYQYALTTALRFHIDNVARWFRATRTGHCDARDVPNIAPLAPTMWFEYTAESLGLATGDRYGALISVDFERGYHSASKWKIPEITPAADVRWILRLAYFSSSADGLGESDYVYFISVGDEGQPLNVRALPHKYLDDSNNNIPWLPDEAQRDVWHEELWLALLSLCFAHCKNTTMRDSAPDRAARRRLERSGQPGVQFKVLDIGPATAHLTRAGLGTGTSVARALHLCRGHFAHYTADAPLFGKLTGTFYIPMHTRGTPTAGLTIKDYRVHGNDIALGRVP